MSHVLRAYVAAQLLLVSCGNDLGSGSATAASSGLPCDIQAVLSDRCDACHGSTLSGGAPVHLTSYSDLTANGANGASMAERCLDRMQNTSAQMPPPPATAVTAADVAAFQAWIAAGMPSGECTTGDSGTFGGPVVCSSGTTWTSGNRESPLMHPGVACIACHTSSGEGPRFKVAGTVYPTGHEPDDCNGADAATGAAVEVADATGKVVSLPVNAAGNFYSTTTITFPIQVAVVANGHRRAMSSSPPTGDCNTCHTQDGTNSAPGRIALP